MAEVRSGSFNTSGYSDPGYPDHYTFSWTLSSQSIVNNTSTITWSLKGAGADNSERFTIVKEKYVTVNGSTQTNSTAVYTYNGTVAFSGTTTIKHSSNGKGSFSASAGGAFYYYGSYNSTGSGSWDLPTIARATTPTLSATSVTMGSSVNITLTPADSSFKHKLSYSFGSLTGQSGGLASGNNFTNSGTVTVAFTPPTSLGAQVPNSTSGTCTINCDTYNSSGTHIGTTTKTLTLNVPSYTPSVTSITLTGVGLLSSTYVQGKSSVTVSATTSTSYGASITSVSSVVDGKTYSGLPFTTSALSNGSKTAKITAVDSRGKTVTVESSAIQVYEYSIPTITEFTLARQSDGTTVIATVKGSIASVNSKNAKTIKVTLNGVTNTITSSSYTVSGTTTFTGVSTDQTFTAKAVFTDSYVSIERTATLPTVAVTMDFYKDGNGIAMGKVAESGNLLDVAWEIKTGKPEKTLSNLSYRGTNLIAQNSNDTIQNWSNQGNLATTFYDDGATGITKPSTWGFLLNVTTGPGTTEAHQLWFEQSNGNLLHRGGNSSGFGAWKTVIDSSNFASNFNTNFSSNFSSSFSSSLASTVKDYVVETGTSGIWTYRKWNSGIAECWGIYTMASSCTLAWGSLFYSNKTCARINYPFTFTSRPQETVSLRLDAYSAWPYADSEGKGMNTTTQTAVYGFLRPSSMGETTIRYEFTVIGRWK